MQGQPKYISKAKKATVLFDGFCNLCNASVIFIIKRDKKDLFRFTTFQSDTGKEIAKKLGIETLVSDTLIVYQHGKIYTQSAAALTIARSLSGLWPLLYAFIIVPPALRNAIYNVISKNRYKWFGRRERCMVPTKGILKKFIQPTATTGL
jgi:predicted DCC family thiol-disulfide oxidoreductase YuxK